MKKFRNTSIVIMLIISLFIPNLNSLAFAETNPQDLGGIFTKVKITIDGEEISDNSSVVIEDNTKLQVQFEYAIDENESVKTGDYAKYKLPDGLKSVGNVKGDLKADGESIGIYYIDEDNYLVLEFNDKVEDKTDIAGDVGFSLEFQEDIFYEDVIQEIVFDEPFELSFIAKKKPNNNAYAIKKFGEYDKEINPTKIIWTVYVNTEMNDIKEANVVDQIPKGLTIIQDSVSVNHVQVGVDGQFKDGDKVEEFLMSSLDPLTIGLGEINSAYKVTFETEIDYENMGEFSEYHNTAILNNGQEKVADSTASLEKVEKQPMINKEGKADNGGKDSEFIDWKIDVNLAEAKLNQAIVRDNLPEGLSIESIEVFKLSSNGNNWNEEIIDREFNEFPIELGEIDSAYRIKLKTKIEDYESYYKNNEFTNTAEFEFDGQKETGSDTVKVERSPLLTKDGKETTDYDETKITWTIKVNSSKQAMQGVIVKDTLPSGVALKEGSIKITKGGQDVTNQFKPEKNESGFEINFGDISDEYIITYDTLITDESTDKFTNKVELETGGLEGDGIIDGGIVVEKEVEQTVKNNYFKDIEYWFKHGDVLYDGINYKDKTISWKFVIDAKKHAIKHMKFTDTFEPEKSMFLIEDTLLILDSKNNVIEAENFNDLGVNGFSFELKDLPRDTYTVRYKTSIDADLIAKEGGKIIDKNKGFNTMRYEGTTTDQNNKEHTVSGESSKDYYLNDTYVNSGSKEGSIDRENRVITWSVYVNELNQDLTGSEFIIKDTFGEKQELVEESITIKQYSLAKDGNRVIENIVDESNYEVTFDLENNTFVVNFRNGIDAPYVLEYQTEITGVSQREYTNKAIITDKTQIDKEYNASVTYENHDKFIAKHATNVNGNEVYLDEEINWEINLNESLSLIENAIVVDEISKGHVFLNESLEVFVGENEITDYELKIDNLEDGSQKLTINLGDIDSRVKIKYTTVVIEEGKVSNKASLTGSGGTVTQESGRELSSTSSSWGSGSYKYPGKITIVKVDENQRPITNLQTTFELSYLLNDEWRVVGGNHVKTDQDGKVQFVNLPFRTYRLKEIEAPTGYVINEQELELTLDSTNREIEYEFENEKIKTSVTVEKEWVNGPEKRPEIELQLLQNGVEHGETVDLKDGQTQYTWVDLDKYDDFGNPYEYTVKEVNVPENYEASYEGMKVINTYVSPKTSVKVEKIWNNGPSKRPLVKLQLLQNGEPIGNVVELDGDWEYVWEDLDKTDLKGVDYNYTVEEVDVPDNYEADYSREDGTLIVTNNYIIPKTEVNVVKEWVNGPKDKPAVKVQLFRDNEPFGDPIKLKDNWEYTWKELDKTDINGNEYEYTVKEVEVPKNYEVNIESDGTDFIITNTYVIPKTEVTVDKVWIDGPEDKPSIMVQLYQNGEAYNEPVLLDGFNSYTWINLDKTDLNGVEHVYTVREVEVPENYVVSYDGHTITNTYVSPKTDVSVEKHWVNGPKDKPAVKVQLFRDGEAYGEIITLDDSMRHVWTDLDQTDSKGREYVYSVEEVEVPENYEVNIESDGTDFIITNTYVIPKTEVTVDKVWIDGPEDKPSIMVQLYQNGEAYNEPVLLDGFNSYTWINLDKTDLNGVEHVYTVREVEVPENYVVSYDGHTITNTYVSPKTDVSVEKHWVNGPKDKPAVKVQLFRDGEAYGEIITLDDSMRHVWTDLDQTDSKGREYVYSVEEVEVPENYEVNIENEGNDFVITNTYVIPKTEVTVDKVWIGGSITGYPEIEVVLMRNGVVIDTVVLSETKGWSHTWDNLDETDEHGVLYDYSVDEITELENYTKTIQGTTIINTYDKKILGTKLPTTGAPNMMLPSMSMIALGIGLLLKLKKED